MAYVEIEKVLETARDGYHSDFGRSMADLTSLQEVLEDTPKAYVEEVRHGAWEKDTDKVRDDGEIYDYRCSLCKGEAHEGEYGNNDALADFCHHCGAKMDGGKKE